MPTAILSGIRTEGNWEAWVSFFLDCVTAAAAEAERSIVEIATLVAADRRRLLDSPKSGSAAYRLFELLPMMPRFTGERARQKLATSFPTANAAVKMLTDLGIVTESRIFAIVRASPEKKGETGLTARFAYGA